MITAPKIKAKNALGQQITEWNLTDRNVIHCIDNLLENITTNVNKKIFSDDNTLLGMKIPNTWYRKLGIGITIDIPNQYAHILENRCNGQHPFTIKIISDDKSEISSFKIVKKDT